MSQYSDNGKDIDSYARGNGRTMRAEDEEASGGDDTYDTLPEAGAASSSNLNTPDVIHFTIN